MRHVEIVAHTANTKMSPQAQIQLLDELSELATRMQCEAQQYRQRAFETRHTTPSASRHYEDMAETREQVCQDLREIITHYQWGNNQ